MKARAIWILIGALTAAVIALFCYAQFGVAADYQVGDRGYLLLKNTSKSATWTMSALKDGASYSLAATFRNNSSFSPGWYEADVTWPAAGEYELRFVPSSGAEVDYVISVVSSGGGLQAIAVLPFQGSVSYETAKTGADVHVFRGDSVSIPYSIGKDITGWTVWFGVKATPADTDYAVPVREITAYVTDPATGSGFVNLSTADTDVLPRRYQAELEIRKNGAVNTPLRFNLWIDADVIR